MLNKELFFSVILAGLFAVSLPTLGDVPKELDNFEVYKWYPAQAESIYQQISADYPTSDYALTAHKNLVLSYITAKRDADAAQCLNGITDDFAGRPQLVEALYEIAQTYERLRQYDAAKGLYGQLRQQYPAGSFAQKIVLDLPKTEILSNIESYSYDEAAGRIDTFIADFNDNTYLPDCLYEIARRYERAKRYDEAGQLYQRIIQAYPQTPAAEGSRFGIAKIDIYSLIGSGDAGAAAAVDKLLGDFAGRSDLPEALSYIATRYEWANAFANARATYQKITTFFPGTSYAARAPLDVSRVDIFGMIDRGDDPNAQSAIDNLCSTFAGHSYLAQCLKDFAKRYIKLGKYDRAKAVSEMNIRNYAGTSYADNSQLQSAKANILALIDANDNAGVGQAIDKLIADFNDHRRLPRAIFNIGEKYYGKADELKSQGIESGAKDYFTRAIAVFERIIRQFPATVADTAPAYYFSGISYKKMGQYEKAIEYYQKVIDTWPDYGYACYVQSGIGFCYDSLKALGALAESEADAKIEQAYTAVIKNYPACSLFEYAAMKLGELNFEKGQWAESAAYFELFLTVADPNDPRRGWVRGKLEKLAEVNK